MPSEPWIEFPLVLVMVVAPAIILYCRLRNRKAEDQSPRGIGARVIQLIALLLLVPAVLILALECKLSGEGVGTVLGVIVGYTLSGISKAVPRRQDSQGGTSD